MHTSKILLSFVLLLLTFPLISQDFNKKKLKKYKQEKRTLIFFVEGTQTLDKALEEVLYNYWDSQVPFLVFPMKEALDYYDKNQETSLLVRVKVNRLDFKYFWRLEVLSAKKIEKAIPDYSLCLAKSILKEDLVFAVKNLQFIFDNIESFKTSNLVNSTNNELKNTYKHLLKEKTLLIPKERLQENLTESELKNIYPFPFLVVPEIEIGKVILAGDPDYLVIYFSECGKMYKTKDGDFKELQAKTLLSIFSPEKGLIINTVEGAIPLLKDNFLLQKVNIQNLIFGLKS